MSAIDSHLKTGRPGIAEMGWQAVALWISAFVGLILAPVGWIGYASKWPEFLLPSYWWAALGAGIVLVSTFGLLDSYAVIHLNAHRHPRRRQIRQRIEAYYRQGQDLHQRLANDSTIPPADTRQFVATMWVNPVTDYLRGTLGERKATYFLAIVRGPEPDEESVLQFGHAKALARARIMVRLERLRKITEGL